jgi:predicted membrane-bound spermidine synthase
VTKAVIQSSLKFLYFISFIEGGVVMVTEIAGARLLTPYFGASLYSWASTLSITLFALMAGYYMGGYLTTRPHHSGVDKILWIFFLSGVTVLLMPVVGSFVMNKTIAFPFFAGLLISEFIFLFPPIFFMGMISPMTIFQITKKAEQSGRSAGNIYAISTLGGILFTLLFGFIVIPDFGLRGPLKVLGVFVVTIALFFIVRNKMSAKRLPASLLIALLALVAAFGGRAHQFFPYGSNKKMVDYSEGLLGELKVVDELVYGPGNKPIYVRKLKTNNIQQDYVFADMPSQSLMNYVNFTRQLVRILPHKSSALLIGLGAGSLYDVLKKENAYVETVEIDARIYDIGKKYFGMSDHASHFITDGRYFINSTHKRYDLVILDVIIGENVPGQLVSIESFRRLREIMSADGTLIIEHGGLRNFAQNRFIPCVVKTLNEAGFQVSMFNPLMKSGYGDVLLVSSKGNTDFGNMSIADDVFLKGGPLSQYRLTLQAFDNRDLRVLTDDVNDVDLLLRDHYFEVRKSIRKELATLK